MNLIASHDADCFFQLGKVAGVLNEVLVFILIGSLIVLNMLVGILVEAVQTVATMEHEQIRVDLAKTATRQPQHCC